MSSIVTNPVLPIVGLPVHSQPSFAEAQSEGQVQSSSSETSIRKQFLEEIEIHTSWDVLAKVIQYACGTVITALGVVLLTVSAVAELTPVLFTAAILVGSGLVITGIWYIVRDMFPNTFPIQKAIENLQNLHARLERSIPEEFRADELFTLDQIPTASELQPVFEFIHKYYHKCRDFVNLSAPEWSCEIIGGEGKTYLNLPLSIGGANRKAITVGIDVDNGDLVAISESRSWPFDCEQDDPKLMEIYLRKKLYPQVFEKLKECISSGEKGGVLPVYQCLDVESPDGERKQQFLIQKLCTGSSLYYSLYQGVVFSRGQKKTIATDLFTGLAELHSKGLLHKDLKPENVLIDSRAYIADFDYLSITAQTSLDQDAHYAFKKDPLVGVTWEYCPPEFFLEGIYDQSSEVYALGVLLYSLFSENPPRLVRELQDMSEQGRPPQFDSLADFTSWHPWEQPPQDTLDYVLSQMMMPDRNKRCTLNAAFSAFQKIPIGQLKLEHLRESELADIEARNAMLNGDELT